jgi:hypothetical protein
MVFSLLFTQPNADYMKSFKKIASQNQKMNPIRHNPDTNGGNNDEDMVAFEEQAEKSTVTGSGRLCAHDLFSSFTADVIKENTLFTR